MELVITMCGMDIFQVHKGTNTVCVVWKPAVTDGFIEIHRIDNNKHILVKDTIESGQLIEQIRGLLELDIVDVEHHNTLYHMV